MGVVLLTGENDDGEGLENGIHFPCSADISGESAVLCGVKVQQDVFVDGCLVALWKNGLQLLERSGKPQSRQNGVSRSGAHFVRLVQLGETCGAVGSDFLNGENDDDGEVLENGGVSGCSVELSAGAVQAGKSIFNWFFVLGLPQHGAGFKQRELVGRPVSRSRMGRCRPVSHVFFISTLRSEVDAPLAWVD
jgi:hypothetical protein